MASYQHTVMKGVLGNALDLRFSENGVPVVNFTLYLNKASGSIRIPCVAFGEEAKKLYEEKTKGATLTLQLEVINHAVTQGEQALKYKVIQLLG